MLTTLARWAAVRCARRFVRAPQRPPRAVMQALSRSGSLGGGVPRSGSLSTGKGKALTDALFQRTLSDIIKGMRSRAADLEPYVAQCIAEIRQEAAHPEPSTKAVAVQKVRRSKSSKPSTPRSGEAAPGGARKVNFGGPAGRMDHGH